MLKTFWGLYVILEILLASAPPFNYLRFQETLNRIKKVEVSANYIVWKEEVRYSLTSHYLIENYHNPQLNVLKISFNITGRIERRMF